MLFLKENSIQKRTFSLRVTGPFYSFTPTLYHIYIDERDRINQLLGEGEVESNTLLIQDKINFLRLLIKIILIIDQYIVIKKTTFL